MTVNGSFTVNEVGTSMFGWCVHVASVVEGDAYYACASVLEELAKSRDVSVEVYNEEEDES